VRALLVAALLSGGAAAAPSPCAEISGPRGPDDPQRREWLRKLVHQVARSEGVDPAVLEALGTVETDLRPAIGRACELGPFQVMQSWAAVFGIQPLQLWDPRINAIAAARIYKSAWRRWEARFAQLGKNRALRAAGWSGAPLDRESFAALAYNWGKAPRAFSRAADLREVAIPASSAAYAVRFSRALREVRLRARADSGTPPGRSRSSPIGVTKDS
jgi:hypothetical protein